MDFNKKIAPPGSVATHHRFFQYAFSNLFYEVTRTRRSLATKERDWAQISNKACPQYVAHRLLTLTLTSTQTLMGMALALLAEVAH